MPAATGTAKNLAEALVAIQADAPHIDLDGTNPHFNSRFATLAGVLDRVLPVTAEHGLAVTQMPTTVDGEPALTTRIVHTSGDALESTMLLLPGKRDPQGQGSALTYARRYMMLAMLGLVGDEDDDGNAASGPAPSAEPAATIGDDIAKKLVDHAWTIGVKDRLQLAASHAAGRDVGDCATKTKATKALAGLTYPQAEQLDRWINRKADEAATEKPREKK